MEVKIYQDVNMSELLAIRQQENNVKEKLSQIENGDRQSINPQTTSEPRRVQRQGLKQNQILAAEK